MVVPRIKFSIQIDTSQQLRGDYANNMTYEPPISALCYDSCLQYVIFY